MVKNINQGFPLFFFAFISNNLIYSKGCAMSRKPRKIVNIPIIFKSKKKKIQVKLTWHGCISNEYCSLEDWQTSSHKNRTGYFWLAYLPQYNQEFSPRRVHFCFIFLLKKYLAKIKHELLCWINIDYNCQKLA